LKLLCVCGRTVDVDDRLAGRVAPCPHCGHELHVPALGGEAPAVPAWKGPEGADAEEEGFAAQALQAMRRKTVVTCGSCGRTLKVSLRLAGRRGRCPACNSSIRIPLPEEQDEAAMARYVAAGVDLQSQTQEDIEVLDELASAVEAAARRPRPTRSRGWIPLVLAAAGVALGAGLLIGYVVLPSTEDENPFAKDGGTADKGPGELPGPLVVPKDPTSRPDEAPPGGQGIPHAARVLSVTPDVVVGRGYFPARPEWVYWRVRLSVQAGDSPLRFETAGEDVMLLVGNHRLPALGAEPAGALLPVRGQRQWVSLRPRREETVTLLFEVPAAATVGTLAIRGVPAIGVGPIEPSPVPDKTAVAGTYTEVAPRNLKPLLRDPVMAAIQQADRQEVRIWPDKGEFAMSISPAGSGGPVKPLEGGLYEAFLRQGNATLNCKLRLGADGYLVLYLADGPFHQMTYLRQGAKERSLPGELFVP